MIVYAVLCAPTWPAESPPRGAVLDELLVTGERPGPGMWRVTRGGHDLWILATLEPLPKKMTWRSQAVQDRIAVSQVVLAPPRVSADVGFFRGLTLLPSLLRARHSPDGETLEHIVPHDLYMRWLGLRVKYLGSGGDEKLRPLLAALDLYTHALDQSGLTSDDSVWSAVEQAARRRHVPVVPVTLTLSIEDPKGAIRELGAIPRDAELHCLEKTIDRLETDLQSMRQRANWWSLGDIDALRTAAYPDEAVACLEAFATVPRFRDQFAAARGRVIAAWLTAAERALDDNQSSFAVLPLTELLQPDGWLARLRDRGCAVEEPR